MLRRIRLIARTPILEAVRRREVYVIVLVTLALILAASTIRFFHLSALYKFYHEVALKTIGVATALTVIVLAARQLPREFERRTIYTLLAKPVSRAEFLIGRYLGIVAAGTFCLALFLAAFSLGWLVFRAPINWIALAQFAVLQVLGLAVLAALAFVLSMLLNLDAAIVSCVLLFLLGHVLTNALVVLRDYVGGAGRVALIVMNYCVPQPALFDLSARVVHDWPPVSAAAMGRAALYAAMFIVPYLAVAYALFRRRAL